MGELNDQRLAELQIKLSNAYYQRDDARRERDEALALLPLWSDRLDEAVKAYNHFRNECRRLEDALTYRFALYSRADKLGLAADRGQPVALFASQALAEAHGRKLYGDLAEVVELSGEQELAR